MIIMSSTGGIQKQVDVWISNEDADAVNTESRSNVEEIDPKVDQRVGWFLDLVQFQSRRVGVFIL